MKKIESTMGPDQPIAAAHLLAARKPAGAIETLLNFLPYANDEYVEEEVLTSLGGDGGGREQGVQAALLGALKDSYRSGGRRRSTAWAGWGILVSGDGPPFFADPDALVRPGPS
ncbi:MAG: hypothetical protein U0793_19665 [Gemmataceae bacterium]